MRLAARNLEHDGLYTVENIRGYGWRVLDASDMIGKSDTHAIRARRQVGSAVRIIEDVQVHREELEQIERAGVDFRQANLLRQRELMRRRRPTAKQLANLVKPQPELPGFGTPQTS
jgi:hypothetical protein